MGTANQGKAQSVTGVDGGAEHRLTSAAKPCRYLRDIGGWKPGVGDCCLLRLDNASLSIAFARNERRVPECEQDVESHLNTDAADMP